MDIFQLAELHNLFQIPVYKTELFCMTTMIDLIVTPRLRNLDMNKLPKILRTHITSRLHVSLKKMQRIK